MRCSIEPVSLENTLFSMPEKKILSVTNINKRAFSGPTHSLSLSFATDAYATHTSFLYLNFPPQKKFKLCIIVKQIVYWYI